MSAADSTATMIRAIEALLLTPDAGWRVARALDDSAEARRVTARVAHLPGPVGAAMEGMPEGPALSGAGGDAPWARSG